MTGCFFYIDIYIYIYNSGIFCLSGRNDTTDQRVIWKMFLPKTNVFLQKALDCFKQPEVHGRNPKPADLTLCEGTSSPKGVYVSFFLLKLLIGCEHFRAKCEYYTVKRETFSNQGLFFWTFALQRIASTNNDVPKTIMRQAHHRCVSQHQALFDKWGHLFVQSFSPVSIANLCREFWSEHFSYHFFVLHPMSKKKNFKNHCLFIQWGSFDQRAGETCRLQTMYALLNAHLLGISTETELTLLPQEAAGQKRLSSIKMAYVGSHRGASLPG